MGFKPIEKLWQNLKSHHLAGFLTKSGKELSDKLYDPIRELLATSEILRHGMETGWPCEVPRTVSQKLGRFDRRARSPYQGMATARLPADSFGEEITPSRLGPSGLSRPTLTAYLPSA